MALNLVIETQDAQRNLEQINTSLDKLNATLNKPLNTANLDRLTSSLSKFSGIPTSALNSITQLGNALDKISRAADIGRISAELNALGRVNVMSVAAGVDRLSVALSRLIVPPGLLQVAGALNAIGVAANTATPALARFQGTLSAVRPGASIGEVSRQLNNVSSSATRAGSALAAGLGVGIALMVGQGVRALVSGLVGSINTFEQFAIVIGTTERSSAAVAQQWQHLQQLATITATPVNDLASAFTRFSAAARETFTAGETQKMFDQLAIAARAAGLETSTTQRVFASLAQSMNTGTLNISQLVTAFGETIPVNRIIREEFGMTADELNRAIQSGDRLASTVLPRLTEALVQATTGQGQLQQQTETTASSFRMLENTINQWASSAYSGILRVVNAVGNLISSLMRAIGLSSDLDAAGGGGGGDSSISGGEFRAGGFSNRAVSSQMVPAAAFLGAPHFAEGGITGGGIPAILHDNEAVVPLSGGRSIPVQMAGGGSQVVILGKIWATTKASNQLIAENNSHLVALGVVVKTEMDRHLDTLFAIRDAITDGVLKVCDELYKITTAVGTLGQAAPAGAGGMGGGFRPGPAVYSPSATGPSMVTSKFNLGRGGGGSQPGSIAYTSPLTGDTYANGSPGAINAYNDYMAWLDQYSLSHGNRFAEGTANTSKDGIPATVHPNEAVIPLSGGRVIPVQLRGQEQIIQQMHDMIADQMSDAPIMSPGMMGSQSGKAGGGAYPGRPDSGGVVINAPITMNIATADANSFNKSKDQITHEMAARLKRVIKKLGDPVVADDPTKRPA